MYIGVVAEASQELHEALQRLVPHLGAHKISPTLDDIAALVRAEGSTLLVAREPDQSGPIVGMLCLAVYRVPTGVRSIIEDVVVDPDARGKGIGAALMRAAIEWARLSGADGISLTSNPGREAANRLYRSLGFAIRQTNSYDYPLK